MDAERWLPVVGYEGWYDISSHGRVRRMKPYNNTYAGLILKRILDGNGYMMANLSKDGDKRLLRIHQLVAAAFIGPCPEGKEVNHKDGIKTNSSPRNLEYVTSSENHLHAFRIGLRSEKGEKNNRSKLTESDVLDIRRRAANEPQAAIAEDFGIHRSTVSKIFTRNIWSCVAEA